ncbi:carboxymuconolactone decarboxylase family protein [Nonomuraea sp. NPDC050202]|uniref:carboxymuconolactone decarboxylase family protein n=1 Tax=Nonomuraea sp. NPDC050202 TaxID=3155035 RepID=UPI0033D2DB54
MLALVTARGVLAQVRHVSPVPPRAARGLVARVYAQLVRDFGMAAPPVLLHSPAPEALAACWMMLRESLLCGDAAARVVKEVVASEVSAANACPYCVDVHHATLRGLRGHDDPRLAAVAAWARATGERRSVAEQPPASRAGPLAAGQQPSCEPVAVGQRLPALQPRLLAEREWPPPGAGLTAVGERSAALEAELIAVAVTFHYLNRMVTVFLGDSPLPPEVPRRARGPALWAFGRLMRPAARRTVPAGASLPLLPAAPLPPDLAWAGSGPLADAFARASAAIEACGLRSVPGPVRDLVTERLAAWTGGPPPVPPGRARAQEAGPPSRAWVTEATAALPGGLRPAATLALLTALAPYQVDDGVVEACRRAGQDDRSLIELTAWASLSAARRVGGRQPAPSPVNGSSVERTNP